MEPIRVLHVEITDQIGGIERYLMNIYQGIDRSLVQFDFVTATEMPAFYDTLKGMGARIFTVASYTKNPFKYYNELKVVMMQGDYQIVHIHKNSAANILPVVIAKKLKVKSLIVHSHNTASTRGSIFNLLHHLNKHRLANNATALLACSKPAAEWMYGKGLLKNRQVTLVHNGIDTEQFRFNEATCHIYRSRLDLEGKFVIGHVGRFTNQKNHTYLLDIFKEVYARNPQAVLLLVGSGELEQQIKEKSNKLGIKDAVQFLGVRQDIPQLMQAMDVFLFPSHYEGLGIVLIEAQATGLRCIASDAVPSEAKITELLTLLSLRQPKEEWVNEILKYSGGYAREDASIQIIEARYDCTAAARSLQEYYLAQADVAVQSF